MWLKCRKKVLDAIAHEFVDSSSHNDGCEQFPLSLGHGLLASNGGSQLDPSISTK
jgi:hypothetical protein